VEEREYTFDQVPLQRGITQLARRINAAIGELHGEDKMVDLDRDIDKVVTVKKLNGDPIKLRLNSALPTAELFSVAQTLVRPADEPFAMAQIFKEDSSFVPGSDAVGYDVIQEQGEAKLVATGRTLEVVPKVDFTAGRALNSVGKIMGMVEVKRDDIQRMALRNTRGIGPIIELMAEKMRIAQKAIDRQEDWIMAAGGILEGAAAGNLPGLKDYFSTNSAEFDISSPTKGKMEAVAAGVGGTTWDLKTSDEIIADIRAGIEYITRYNVYKPTHMVVPPAVFFGRLGFMRTADVDSTPLLRWISQTFKELLKQDVEIVPSNAMTKGVISGTTRRNTWLANSAFMLIDASKECSSRATVEQLTLLKAEEDLQGTIRQVLQKQTGGLMIAHRGAGYIGTGIA
jgi:hypothetical protein